ncbi:MAG: hypothetical protein N3A72_10905 [bacterium]|nr:hypothetical protein [bacterium]
MFKKIIILSGILLLSTSLAFSAKWSLYKTFYVDTTITPGVSYMWLAADANNNLYASGFNSNATPTPIHFYKISNWLAGTPTFLAFDTSTMAMPQYRGGLGIAVDADGNIYGAVETGAAASSYYKIWNPSLAEITTVLNPSSGRPTGIAVDNDTTNPKGRHLFHGDLLNGKIRVRNMLDQSIAGGATYDQLKPGTYPRDIVIQPIAGTDTIYNLWVNRSRDILRFNNVSGRAIEADITNILQYACDTIVDNADQNASGLGIAYDNVKNTVIYSGGSLVGSGIGHTMQIINATTGAVVQVLGVPDESGNDDAHFNFPSDAVVVTASGKRYLVVSDYGNWRMKVYSSAIPVTPNTPKAINPGGSVLISADTTNTVGTITWTMSTTGLGQLSALTGPEVTFTAQTGNISGTLTITATDEEGDTGTTAVITITPTSAPLIIEDNTAIAPRFVPLGELFE